MKKFKTSFVGRFLLPAAFKILILMKLTFSLLLIAALSAMAGETYSQSKKLTIGVAEATVEHVLSEIENQSEFYFFYSEKVVDVKRKVSLDIRDQNIENVLNELFAGTNVAYAVKDRIIVLSTTDIMDDTSRAFWQQAGLTGKVTDKSGAPLPGVTVIIKGTTTGTITDNNGNYIINNVPPNSTLVFSFVGMRTQDVVVGTQSVINLTMIEETIGIEEVVAVGYGTQKKINLTGAVSQVDSKVLESRPITNLGQGLQGTVANLIINPVSGAPGRGVTFNIRGTTSINGGSPLVLVDGVQMDPNLINPQDVKSISVLKDAASAAIYGARAAFGVILITTKSGLKSQKPVVSFSSNYSVNKPTVVPEYMNSIEYTSWMNEGFTTTNGRPYFDEETMQNVRAYFNDPVKNLPVFRHSSDASNFWRYCGNTNWMEELLNDTYPMQQHTLSVNGGTDNLSYYTSIGYFNQKGISKPGNENYNRYNFMQNLSYNVTDWLMLTAKASVNSSDNLQNPQNKWGSFAFDNMYVAGDSRPLMPVYHPDGYYAGYSGNGYFTNIVAFIEQGGHRMDKVTDLWLTGAMKITPLKSWTINIDYTHNIYNSVGLHYLKQYWDYDANGPAVLFPHTTPNSVTKNNSNNKYTSFNAYTEYENTFAEKHYFKGMIGFNQELVENAWFSAQRQKLISNEIPYMSLASGDRFANDTGSEYAIRGVFSRLNYSFADRYLFEFNGRYDGSSRFPTEDRFEFFPSGSVGWRVSNESFWGDLRNTVNDLKFRASYGNLGNQTVASYYPYVAVYGTNEVDYLLAGERPMTVTAPGLVSPTLTWEKVTQYNIGVDFALFSNRLNGTFDIYRRDTKDMLTGSSPQPSILGTSEPQTNAADMKTYGYDITISYHQVFNNGLRWSTDLIFADAQSEITKFNNPNGLISTYYVGRKIGEIWGFVTEGLFQSDAEAAAWDQSAITGHKLLAGDLKFADLNDDKKITRGNQTLANPGDLKIIGNNTPRYNYGFKNDFEWKDFDLSFFFQGVGKRDLSMGTTYFLAHYGSEWAVPQKINTDYWSTTNTNALFPRPRIGGAGEVTQAQTRFLQNAAYIRLKQLTFGYTLPKALTQKVSIDRCRIYFSGNNLWEYTPMLEIFDPEVSQTNTYPHARSFSVGLNVTL
jgi:TonB-linked SusC/RagA family outer membrane protein